MGGIKKPEARVIEALCLLGLLASQSRQAAILLVLALVTAVLINSEVRGRAKLVIFITVPTLVLVYESFVLAFRNNPQFNSVAIRFTQIDAALHVRHQSPWLGLGMHFYNLPQSHRSTCHRTLWWTTWHPPAWSDRSPSSSWSS